MTRTPNIEAIRARLQDRTADAMSLREAIADATALPRYARAHVEADLRVTVTYLAERLGTSAARIRETAEADVRSRA